MFFKIVPVHPRPSNPAVSRQAQGHNEDVAAVWSLPPSSFNSLFLSSTILAGKIHQDACLNLSLVKGGGPPPRSCAPRPLFLALMDFQCAFWKGLQPSAGPWGTKGASSLFSLRYFTGITRPRKHARTCFPFWPHLSTHPTAYSAPQMTTSNSTTFHKCLA